MVRVETERGISERIAAPLAKGLSSAGVLEKGKKLFDLTRGVPLKGLGSVGLSAGAVVGIAAIAGIAAYTLASAALNYRARTREDRAENAFRAARAYRVARTQIEEKQQRPLTAAQLGALKISFNNELAKLGLSTTNLSGL